MTSPFSRLACRARMNSRSESRFRYCLAASETFSSVAKATTARSAGGHRDERGRLARGCARCARLLFDVSANALSHAGHFEIEGVGQKIVKVGEVLYTAPNTPHYGRNATDKVCRTLVVRIKAKDQPVMVEVKK